ncbi:hypothetical protein CTI12_AA089330 [Artemisia annua]|uniref:Ig-like domain-containing protein n=1 Tax=Artemisia annua TaxID=35608 RepID=A0A2U1Q0U1_ARTAN|nr:hypothetical protein CTI12_AA089330 [Artemisia annua]
MSQQYSSNMVTNLFNWSVIGRNETTPTKRPRKKKTLAELKEDETALKERKQLKRQVANLQAACEKRRKENESLNKMKNDMQPHKQGLATSEVNNHMEEKDSRENINRVEETGSYAPYLDKFTRDICPKEASEERRIRVYKFYPDATNYTPNFPAKENVRRENVRCAKLACDKEDYWPTILIKWIK